MSVYMYVCIYINTHERRYLSKPEDADLVAADVGEDLDDLTLHLHHCVPKRQRSSAYVSIRQHTSVRIWMITPSTFPTVCPYLKL